MNSLSSSPALIKKLVWSLAGEVETAKQKNNTLVKFECYEAPKILMREQVRLFLCKHFFVDPFTDSKLISFLAAQSDIIIVQSDLFLELDYSNAFGYLHSVYKRFLQELIIDSRWNGMIKSNGCLSVSGHLILIKDNVSSSPSVAALLKILQPRNKVDPEEFAKAKKELVTIPKGAKIEDLVNENYRKRWLVLTAPVAGGSAIKVKQEEDGCSW